MTTQRYCQHCGNIIITDAKKFCSRDCKSQSQKLTITVFCDGCGKPKKIWPCHKRKTNYCSVSCYHQSTNKKIQRECIVCHKEFRVKNYLVKNGFGKFCSLKCQHKTYEQKRILRLCKQCGVKFERPPSVVAQTAATFCTKKCADDFARDYETCVCLSCGKSFVLPTWETKKGKGKFCSRRCHVSFQGESSIEMVMRQALEQKGIKFEQEAKFGKYHADFFLPKKKIIIECDGDHWHTTSQAKLRDHKKDEFLKSLGYRVFRFTGSEINLSVVNCLNKLI